jgi:hypothetical protein
MILVLFDYKKLHALQGIGADVHASLFFFLSQEKVVPVKEQDQRSFFCAESVHCVCFWQVLLQRVSKAWAERVFCTRTAGMFTHETKKELVIMEKTNTNGRSIEKELFIKATPQRVFLELTEQAELERWFLVKAELDLRPGGAISFEWDRARGVYNVGTILVLDPPHRLSYTWEATD